MCRWLCPGATVRGRGIRMRPWRRIVFHSSSVSVWRGVGGEASSLESSLESSTRGGGVSRAGGSWVRWICVVDDRCWVVVCDGVNWVRVGND